MGPIFRKEQQHFLRAERMEDHAFFHTLGCSETIFDVLSMFFYERTRNSRETGKEKRLY